MQRPLVLALVALLAIPVGALAVGVSNPLTPVPAPDQELSFADVSATIIRDQWGVPHVYADDAYSLFFANGYAQAGDRLAQMEILRHVALGRAAELLGPAGLELDLVTRRELYTHDERVAALEALPQQWQDAFQAFADGVNHRIVEATATGDLPVEYAALVTAPRPWEATDTVAIAQYLLDVFGRGGGGQEARNAQILALLKSKLGEAGGAAAFDDLVSGINTDAHFTIKPGDVAPPQQLPWTPWTQEIPHDLSDLSTLEPAQHEAYLAALSAENVADTFAPISETLAELGWPFKMGSNAQLIDESLAANGKPMLYGGPQMAYYAPMIPYEIGLHGAGFDAAGMGIAGAPGVIIGRNADLSYTITSGGSDQVDVVVEKLVDFDTYIVDNKEVDMDCRDETHLVRPGPVDFAPDADPAWRPPVPEVVVQEVCRTIHGPVLARTPDGQYAFASYRTYRGHEAASGVLWLQIGTVTDLDGLQDLFDAFRFTFNFNAVSDDGGLLYMHVGAQPVRDDRLDPRLPMPGWDSSYDWKGLRTGADLPHIRDPASGYTVNWNNNPTKHWHSGDQKEKWGTTHRADLMEATLLAKIDEVGLLTMDDLREINRVAATTDPYADDTYPFLHAAAVAIGNTEAITAAEAWAAAGFTWNPDPSVPADDASPNGYHYPGFRLYELWRSELQTLLYDEIEPFADTLVWNPPDSGDPHAADHGEQDMPDTMFLWSAAGGSNHPWCNIVGSNTTETCATIARLALQAAIGSNPDWADPFPLRHSKFVALGALSAYEIPMTNRPSFQHFHDWGLPEGDARSRNVLPPGASGHMNAVDFLQYQAYLNGAPVDPPAHVEDQLQMYVDFADKPLLHARSAVEQYEESRTTFGQGG